VSSPTIRPQELTNPFLLPPSRRPLYSRKSHEIRQKTPQLLSSSSSSSSPQAKQRLSSIHITGGGRWVNVMLVLTYELIHRRQVSPLSRHHPRHTTHAPAATEYVHQFYQIVGSGKSLNGVSGGKVQVCRQSIRPSIPCIRPKPSSFCLASHPLPHSSLCGLAPQVQHSLLIINVTRASSLGIKSYNDQLRTRNNDRLLYYADCSCASVWHADRPTRKTWMITNEMPI
jgi:hypothetical protein